MTFSTPRRAGLHPLRPGALTDEERYQSVRRVLEDGTAMRLRVAAGFSAGDLARQVNVTTWLLEAWEQGAEAPSRGSALKLWEVLVRLCRTPEG